jgi:hypothetical protein
MQPAPSPPQDPAPLALPVVPRPGFSVTPPPAELPGFDASQSPLSPGGRPGAPEPLSVRMGLLGLAKPHLTHKPRVVYRVRREGWVSRRQAARSRFATISGAEGPSTPRILRHLLERGGQGLLGRATGRKVQPRFDLRGR